MPMHRRIYYVDRTGKFPVYKTGELTERSARHHPKTSGGMKGMLDRMRQKQTALAQQAKLTEEHTQ